MTVNPFSLQSYILGRIPKYYMIKYQISIYFIEQESFFLQIDKPLFFIAETENKEI
jgi:hypothetical protein